VGIFAMASSGDSFDLPAQTETFVTGQTAPDSSDDAALVRAAQRGDRTAFGQLYQRYAPMVHGVLLAKVPTSTVDDLVQDVFIRALRRMTALRKCASFGAWLAAIARNLANDYHRRSPREEQWPENDSQHDIAAPPVNTDSRTQAIRILQAIRGLPDAYREPLILRFVEGMTGPEIAARTGLTPGSVRVNLHRGMQLLRASLRPDSRQIEQENS